MQTSPVIVANGHAAAIPVAAPVPVPAHNVELDPKKLGLEGHALLGQIEALQRWALMFSTFRDRSLDINERRTLAQVIDALGHDIERLKVELTQFALKRGAAKVTDNDGGEGA